MKKIIVIIVAVILAACAAVGIIFGVRSCNNKADENNTTYKMLMLEDEYTVGDNVIFDFYAYSDIEFVGITYKINNGAEKSATGFKTGEAKDHKSYNGESGKYYIDTAAQVIDTSEMSTGWYSLVLYGTAKDGGVHQINKTPYIFQIVAAVVPAE